LAAFFAGRLCVCACEPVPRLLSEAKASGDSAMISSDRSSSSRLLSLLLAATPRLAAGRWLPTERLVVEGLGEDDCFGNGLGGTNERPTLPGVKALRNACAAESTTETSSTSGSEENAPEEEEDEEEDRREEDEDEDEEEECAGRSDDACRSSMS